MQHALSLTCTVKSAENVNVNLFMHQGFYSVKYKFSHLKGVYNMNFCIFEGHGKEGIAEREGTALVRLLLATSSELPQWDAMSNTDHECRQQHAEL